MVRIEHTLEIDRPVAEVFAYLTDLTKLPEWQSTALEVRQETEGPVREGSRFREVRKFLGRRFESTLEVTAYEPDRRFDVRADGGPVPYAVRHTLEPTNGGTRLHLSGEAEPGGFFRLAEPMVTRAVRRELAAHLETLKDVLEGGA